MERTEKCLTGSLQRILLLAAAFTLLGAWPTCFAAGETRAVTVAGFNLADYKVCGVTIVSTTGTQARSFAIIEYLKTGEQGMYQLGDMLSGARITQINKNSVTLVIGEKKHVLRVETSTPATTAMAVQPERSLTPVVAPPEIRRQMRHRRYNPPGSILPEPTVEEVMKNIEQEQSQQAR